MKSSEALYELALFVGAGGGLLASQWMLGHRTVCYVEWEQTAVDMLKQRIRDGYLHDAPIWDNVRTFDGRPWRGCVDIITAGFPCQPFSTAGKRQGKADLRNGWPDTLRIIREVCPERVFLENVPGLLSAKSYYCQCGNGDFWHDAGWNALYCPFCWEPMDKATNIIIQYFGTILRDLAESGYDARWRVLGAYEVGANHKRERVWIEAVRRGDVADGVRH